MPVRADQAITFGLHMNKPLNFMDKDGQAKGLVIDVFNHIAKQEGWRVTFVPCKWSQCLDRLKNGEIDVLSAIGYTAKRKKIYDFTDTPLITNWGLVVTQPDTAIQSITDLEGVTIAVMKRAGHTTALQTLLKKFGVNAHYLEVDSFKSVLQAVSDKKADAGVVNRLFASQFANHYQVLKSSIIYNPIEIRYAFTKGQHRQILNIVDRHLLEMRKTENSVYFQSLNHWFGNEEEALFPGWLKWVAGSLALISGLLLAVTWVLNNRVAKAIEKVREGTALFKAIVEAGPLSLFISDTETDRLVFVNDRARTMFGIPAHDREERYLSSRFFKDHEDQRSLRRILELGGTVDDREFEMKRLDGSTFWGSITATPMPFEGANTIATSILDRTRRKRAECERRQSEERFRDFSKSASDWLWEMDENLRFSYFSDRFTGISGIAEEDLIGKTRQESGLDMEDESVRHNIEDLEARRPFKDFEHSRVRSDGSIVHMSTTGTPIFDDLGSFRGYRGTGADITERKTLQQQLYHSQRMDAVGQLTSGIAHDFNNLMGVMLGNAEILDKLIKDDEQARRNVEAIIKAVNRGASLTDRLLAFSRQQPLSPRPMAINDLVVDLEEMLRRSMGEIIELSSRPGSGVSDALIDPHQFENALVNLAINARDAMPEGGSLTIETADVTLNEADVEQDHEVAAGDYVRVTVTDNGPGMPPEVLCRVFEPFFTTKGVGEGSGLGLSMVYGFIKQSNGHVAIDSEVGRGTTVELYLPQSQDTAGEEQPAAEAPVSVQGSERILVVEDDEDLLDILTSILQYHGYQVVAAENARQAIDLLEGGKTFDLLFTDVVLPGGMNGVEIADEAKRIQPDIKVILTSGYAENAAVNKDIPDRGLILVNKPYREKELLEKVRRVLDG